MSNMLVHLPTDLYSPEQLSAVVIELRTYIGVLRDATVRARATKSEVSAPGHLSALLLGVFRGAGADSTDIEASEKLLKELEAIRDKAPAVHLMMAALPNRDLKRKFTDWFRASVHPYTLLTFATRADIGGGIVVQAGSHIYDYSFRQQILANRTRISEIYARVRQ